MTIFLLVFAVVLTSI